MRPRRRPAPPRSPSRRPPGAEALALQRLLNRLGAHPPLEEDGKFGAKTEAAVRAFQQRMGCKVDGVLGPGTMAVLDRAQGFEPSGAAPSVEGPAGSAAPAGVGPAVETGGAGGIGHGAVGGPHASIPARSLTEAQAIEELKALRAQGKVQFEPPDPRPGKSVKLLFPIDGVNFRSLRTQTPDASAGGLNPRMAVATVRLAEWAKSQGATEITHRGFKGHKKNVGRALDIAGFKGADPRTGQAFDYDVLRDWGKQPSRGRGYRLDPSTGAGRMFQDAYEFLKTQFRDSRRGSEIGGPSYILSPDHPDPKLRAGHQNHFHVELPPEPQP